MHGPRVVPSVQLNVYPMHLLTDIDISKYVTIATRQIIWKESSIKKLVVDIDITESRLFKEEGSA